MVLTLDGCCFWCLADAGAGEGSRGCRICVDSKMWAGVACVVVATCALPVVEVLSRDEEDDCGNTGEEEDGEKPI